MEELFGIPMPVLMYVLFGIFIATLLVVVAMALRNTVMLKLGIRPISRRPGMTALIIIGIMLSTIIISAAFGTADTLTYSIRDIAINGLRNIDEVIIPARTGEGDEFGQSFIPMDRFEQLSADLAGDDRIDGLMPQLSENVPALNPDEDLSEGRTNLVGIDPAHLSGFGSMQTMSGGTVSLESLAPGEAYVNERAARELELQAGGRLRIFVDDQPVDLTVKGVAENGSFAGIGPTILLPLSGAQDIFGRPESINSIAVSNRGDQLSGNELSEEVTRDLRIRFTDRETATKLKETLGQPAFLDALEEERDDTSDPDLKADLEALLADLRAASLTETLVGALADDDIRSVVFDILGEDDMREVQREAVTLFSELAEFLVLDIKFDILRGADQAGTGVSSFFLIFSTFSIASGIMLIFLIFVLLAGARKSEMGMARAVGAKRRHLVQMFVFEGTAYALVSAAIGVVLGLAVSAMMVGVLNSVFSALDDDFTLQLNFTLPTIVVSYCLGMIITFATVGISAYRVSHLDIVSAVRNLPESLAPPEPPSLSSRLVGLLKGIFRPAIFLWRSLRYVIKLDMVPAVLHLVFTLVWLTLIVWLLDILVQLFRLVWPYLLRGWLLIVIGAALGAAALDVDALGRSSLFGGGVSLFLVGIGLLARTLLARGDIRPDVLDRIVFTATGVAVLVFWALPGSLFETITGELEGDFDVMFVSGIAMVGAAVWTVMYNADLILGALQLATGRFRQLRPVLVTAVAYPLSSKFRTGMTLAMFALVIFTLTIMSILTETFGTQFVETRVSTGGWDIRGSVNPTTPIDDIRSEIEAIETVELSQLEAIGGYTGFGVQVREVEADDQEWSNVGLRAADDGYLQHSAFDLKLIADGFGPAPADVFEAMRSDPSLVVIPGSLLDDTQGEQGQQIDRVFHQVSYDDESMSPFEIEVREPSTRTVVNLKVVGVIDRVHNTNFGSFMIGSKEAVEQAAPFPIPITTYQFRVADLDESKQIAQELERAFLANGMQTEVLEEVLDEQLSALRGFFRLFTGFMALGLFVGIAALGVVSTRAVVERRQQIGMLRAVGYRRSMIQLSFLVESSFVAVLGLAIGAILGIVLSYNAVTDIRAEQGLDTIVFSIPWLQMVVILGVTYLFSLLATYLPARQASRIYPAEALRYE